MVLDMDIASTSLDDLYDCGRVVSFMESINGVGLQPADSQLAYRVLNMNYGMNESGIPFDHMHSTFQEAWFCWDKAQCAQELAPSHRVWPENVKGLSVIHC